MRGFLIQLGLGMFLLVSIWFLGPFRDRELPYQKEALSLATRAGDRLADLFDQLEQFGDREDFKGLAIRYERTPRWEIEASQQPERPQVSQSKSLPSLSSSLQQELAAIDRELQRLESELNQKSASRR